MSTLRKTDHVTGWYGVGVLATIAAARMLTALVISFPTTWLVRHIFADAPLRFVFGADGFSYWRCAGLFVIWFTARVRVKFSWPAQIEIQGER
jgi:hypothetical protein